MLVGVVFLPPSLIPALRNISILHHKKAKLPKHLQHSVGTSKAKQISCYGFTNFRVRTFISKHSFKTE